jgi:acetylornithine deacetylase/succinyl-diaminopimelate desuccinylase-like protein
MIGPDMELKRVHEYIDRIFPEHLTKTQEFLRQPSISAEGVGLVETARWLKEYIEALEAQVKLAEGQKAPIVFARFDLGKPKTLLVYGMYDVQPVAGQTWSSPPFDAEIRELPRIGPCIIARGACNSKGPLMGFLNAIQAMKKVSEIPINLILTIEGEEEIGSPTLPSFYQQNKERLKADAGFEPFWSMYGTGAHKPTLTLGTKGIVSLELICRGGEWGGPVDSPIHSHVGAWLASPTWRLIKALSTLVREDEEINIEGFNEEIVVLPEDEELLSSLGTTFNEKDTLRGLGAQRFKYPLHGTELLRKYFFSPSISVSILGQAEGDIIPSEARVRLDIRLVPEMDPERTVEKLRRHLAAQGYGDIEFSPHSGYPGARSSIKEKVVQCMIEAYKYHGQEPEIRPISSSATPYYLFSQVLGIPYVWGGLGRAGRSHAPDEFASVEGLRLFEKSIVTFLYKFANS